MLRDAIRYALVLAVLAALLVLAPPALSEVAPALGIVAVLDLQRKRKEILAQIAPLAEIESLTPDQQREWSSLHAQARQLAEQIERAEFVAGERAVCERIEDVPRPSPQGQQPPRPRNAPKVRVENPGFESVEELLYCAVTARGDRRIQALQEMNTGTSGGFAVPDEFVTDMMQVTPDEAIVRPRAVVMPMGGDAPEASVTLPFLNQTSGANMYGGAAVDWIGEGVSKPDTSVKLREMTLTPKEVAASIVVTDKLLRNWRGADAAITRQLRGALIAAEDVAFISGIGIGRPLGALNSPALVTVARQVANDVSYEDLVNMEVELLDDDGEPIWVVTKRALPRLRLMEDNSGRLIYMDGARDGGMPTLLGKPVVMSHRSPALGAKGDVLLANWNHYRIRDGVAITLDASKHVHFQANKTMIKAFRSVDGAPDLDAAIRQEDGKDYSPFVALDVPA